MPSTAGASASGTGSSYKPMSYTHLAWSIGHIVVLLSTIWNTLGILFLQSRPKAYSLAYGGAILSWSIVVYKSLGTPSLSKAYLQRAAMDENVQYLVVALYWFFSKPIFVTLLPFAIFSTFHSLSFIRTTFLPKVPSKKDASGAEQPQQVGVVLSRGIQSWVKQNYESAMYCVAFIEVLVIQGRVTLGALTFQNSFLHPLFFAHFLRLRYYLSPQTRSAVSAVNQHIDHYLDHPSCPAMVKKGTNIARGLVTQYADSIISTTAAHPPGRTGPQTPNSVNNRTTNSG
ncbi:hypothetical protein MJO28_005060 [Puccinia striiformis f. sp. tritici]|uniref:Endoplasmic reticulum protein n=4 Tax=Puccinia striiformis TaxID=27350 RepID=A0A0L0VCH6_9BASI|nr:hypothetical protein Pst134EA_009193 [Puccinia striiformis f. sp. tritici]KAI9617734.1 hypothetical protein KEM48_007037 [Puccinia striiformis f. sp. tritici PST-130]KNE96978.1 hypothetical protein PSTG_09713 [Puccinia striiformis f. sp. tritici PST-78]POW00397.1 hypothetical protein PSHT_13038 [Puccinia striiformis]KAH9458000.1 hypothetical protein Pst134EB_010304 [Puccinia striiformis f. sp. tritici]KAH9468660.1 hypothetical protein Pst134EA_009193 [Puccinia striiformis f. sp. tritici]